MIASLFIFSGASRSSPPLSPLQVHPLPPSLANWRDLENRGDYFDSLENSEVGALIWSRFPVTVFVRPDRPAWLESAREAIGRWSFYLPLQEVTDPENADILIEREFPPSGVRWNPETRQLDIPRVRSAVTRYEIFIRDGILTHRMILQISPNLNEASTLAALRHELGHALGIWGHSPMETDAMYFSQTRELPPISTRDVNTLRKVYEQATRLGWRVEE